MAAEGAFATVVQTTGNVDANSLISATSVDTLHGSAAAARRAAQDLMFFASIGDVVRCQTLARTAREWYGAKIVQCRDYDARTPLHLAAANGCHAVVQWLLEAKRVPPNPVDRKGHTPLEDAIKEGNMEVAALLRKYGGQVVREGQLMDPDLFGMRSYEDSTSREWEIAPGELTLQEKIGEGSFGTVFKATWCGTVVAVKALKRCDNIAMGDFRSELDVLQKVHHPNCVQFLGACTKKPPYMIVTEYMPCGALDRVLQAPPERRPSLRRALIMAADTAQAMAYLHSEARNVVIHRDLKPSNILIGGIHAAPDAVFELGAKLGIVKVADFGLSRITTLSQPRPKKTAAQVSPRAPGEAAKEPVRWEWTGETGTYRYMAPEVFLHEPYNSKADVYSFAMICYELFEGSPPWHSLTPFTAAEGAAVANRRPKWGARNRMGQKVPAEVRKLVEDCWAADADKRPDFLQINACIQALLAQMPEEQTALQNAKLDMPAASAGGLEEVGGKQGCSANCCIQ